MPSHEVQLNALLFQNYNLCGIKLKSRIVMAPMTRSLSPQGIPTAETAAYYARRAVADVGLIITEGTPINHPGANGYAGVPLFYGDKALKGWAQVVDKVHQAGGAIFPQLWHVGKVRPASGMEPDPSVGAFGPMEEFEQGTRRVTGMSQHDIDDVIEAFAKGAKAAREIGFDGIELHGAHGYLIDQFLWEGTNRRTDLYGGSLQNRARFAVEIIRATRATVGPDFPICLRFSQWKMFDYNARLAQDEAQLNELLQLFVKAGVSIFHASTRRYWLNEFTGSSLNLAGITRKITGKPTITVGSVGLEKDFITTFGKGATTQTASASLDKLLLPLQQNHFDLVAVGRALLADPLWATKVKELRFADIIPYSDAALAKLL